MTTSNKKQYSFDHEAYCKILDDNNAKVVESILSVAYDLTITLKYGSGIINKAILTEEQRDEVRMALAPLIKVIEREATMSFARVLNGVLATPNLNDYLQQRTAAVIGKAGGRKKIGYQAPHKVWLEEVMRHNQHRMYHSGVTVKDHLRMIASHPDILEQVDGVFYFNDEALDRFGNETAIVSEIMVKKMFTHIKKYPI